MTIKSQLKNFLEYKGKNTKLPELERKSAFDYQYFRKEKKAQDVTIRNEQATINALIKWGFENGLCSLPKFEFDKISIKEVSRRDTFTAEEYYRFSRYLRERARTVININYLQQVTAIDHHGDHGLLSGVH